MDNTRRAQIIRAHLEATSRTGSAPRPERIGVWLHELQEVPGAMLDACISQTREEHATRAENGKAWGAVTPDDVKRGWRRISKKDRQSLAEPPENRHCPIGCERGRVLFDDPKGYEVCVRCSCPAGDWWGQFPTWGAMPNADDLLSREGFKLQERSTMPETHKRWIADRAAVVGHRQAISEYLAKVKEHKQQG